MKMNNKPHSKQLRNHVEVFSKIRPLQKTLVDNSKTRTMLSNLVYEKIMDNIVSIISVHEMSLLNYPATSEDEKLNRKYSITCECGWSTTHNDIDKIRIIAWRHVAVLILDLVEIWDKRNVIHRELKS